MTKALAEPLSISNTGLIDALRGIPLFSVLNNTERKKFITSSEYIRFPKNTVLMREGDLTTGLYIILSGSVRTYLSSDRETSTFVYSREVTIGIETRGACIGEIAMIDQLPRATSVKVLEPSDFILISRERIVDCMAVNPSFALTMAELVASRCRNIVSGLKQLAFSSVYSRVSYLLQQRATQEGDCLVVKGRLTHQNIAELVGCSRGMISRIIRDLIVDDYIERKNRDIIIKKPLPTDANLECGGKTGIIQKTRRVA